MDEDWIGLAVGFVRRVIVAVGAWMELGICRVGAEWRVRDRCLVPMLMLFVYVVGVVEAGSAIFDKGCWRQTKGICC